MRFHGILNLLFAFALFHAVDPEQGGGNADDRPEDTPPADDKPEDKGNSELEALKLKLSAMEEKFSTVEKERDEFKSKIETAEQKKLEEEGDYKKLYEGLKEKFETTQKTYTLSQARSAVKSELLKNGCTDADDLLVLMQKDVRKLEVDSKTFEPDQKSISDLVGKYKESKPRFFEQPAPNTEDINQTKPKQKAGSIKDNLRKALF